MTNQASEDGDLRGMIVHFTSEMLDNPNDYGIYPTTNFYNDLEEALLDWHNKQTTKELDAIMEWHEKEIEEVLDRLSAQVKRAYDKEGDFLEMAVDTIEAERNKLKWDKEII